MRKARMFAMIVVASLAICATAAQGAVAASFESESEAATTITGNQAAANLFFVTGLGASCETVSYHSSLAGAAASLTVKPTFTSCTAFGHVGAKITGFGHYGEKQTCDLVLHASGTMDINCEAGAEIYIDAGTCLVKIPGQTGLGTVSYENNGGHIDVKFEINEITLDHIDGFLCPFVGNGSDQNIGTFEGKSTFEGEGGVAIAWVK